MSRMFGIANLITAANLLGGICSIIFSLSGRLDWAVLVLAISALFDFLDGFDGICGFVDYASFAGFGVFCGFDGSGGFDG